MDEFILVADEDVLPHGVVGLNQVQIHAVEKVFPSFQQGVGFCQKGAHQLAGGGVAGINDQCQLLDLFAFPAFQRLDERQVAVHRKAVGVEVQIELVRVQLYLLAQDAEPAQKVLVAAAAAVGGFHLLLQRIGALARLFIPQVQLGLHPLPDLLPRFLRQRGGHLLGLLRGILRPQAVVVGDKFPLQLPQHAGRLPGEPAVHRRCRHHLFLSGDLPVGVLPHIGQRAHHAFAL